MTKILIDEAVVKQALEALELLTYTTNLEGMGSGYIAIQALRQALADAEQPAPAQSAERGEPVAFETREIGEGDWFRVPLKDRARIAGIIESPHMDYRWLCTAPLATAQRITAYYRNVERQPIAVEAAHGITSGEATKKGGEA